MHLRPVALFIFGLFSALAARAQNTTAPAAAPAQPATAPAAATPAKPTIYIAGDSTANNGRTGWGTPFATMLDPAKVTFVNSAFAGRSSRTFMSDGAWENRILSKLKPGDIVFIQFGHNDLGAINDPELPPAQRRSRGTIPGLGEETEEIDNVVTNKHEIVHTFGWYMRKYIAETRAKGAIPILLTSTVRNKWAEGKVERGPGNYSQWTRELAQAQNVPLVDLTNIVADQYEVFGEAKIPDYIVADGTHSTALGAEFNATAIVAGLKSLKAVNFAPYLSEKGQAIPAADVKYVAENKLGTSPTPSSGAAPSSAAPAASGNSTAVPSSTPKN